MLRQLSLMLVKFMKNKLLKLSIAFYITFSNTFSVVFASNIKEWFKTVPKSSVDIDTAKNNIFSILTYIGFAASLCVIVFTGIQFLTANPQKKAQLKEKLWLIVLGICILAGGIPVLQIIAGIIEGMRAEL